MFHKIKAAVSAFWAEMLLAASILLFVFFFFVQPNITHAAIRGSSMEPSLTHGQHLIAVAHTNIHRGDIVIADSDAFGCTIVKRVIAVPGDTISIKDDVVFLNGMPLDEPYIAEEPLGWDMPPLSLEEDMYFLMGDNRNHSSDSRDIGPLKRDDILYVIPLQHQAELFIVYLLILFSLALPALYVSEWGIHLFATLYRKVKHRKRRSQLLPSYL